jgi:hypothetical protein
MPDMRDIELDLVSTVCNRQSGLALTERPVNPERMQVTATTRRMQQQRQKDLLQIRLTFDFG